MYGEKEETKEKIKLYIYGIGEKPKMEQTYFREYYPLGFLKIKINTMTAMHARMHSGGMRPRMPLSSSGSVVSSSTGLVVVAVVVAGLVAYGVVCTGMGLVENW